MCIKHNIIKVVQSLLCWTTGKIVFTLFLVLRLFKFAAHFSSSNGDNPHAPQFLAVTSYKYAGTLRTLSRFCEKPRLVVFSSSYPSLLVLVLDLFATLGEEESSFRIL